jgi:PadR family transcriptional regulator, regulatory protein PadR
MGGSKEGELLQGTLDMLILKTLARGAKHGYAIAEWICETSDDILRVEEGALYPALHRLELKELLEAEWGVSENNRRARFYRLTRVGRKALAADAERWSRLSLAIARVMGAADTA